MQRSEWSPADNPETLRKVTAGKHYISNISKCLASRELQRMALAGRPAIHQMHELKTVVQIESSTEACARSSQRCLRDPGLSQQAVHHLPCSSHEPR